MGTPTSTKTITRLGALTVIAQRAPDAEQRRKANKEIKLIATGGTHVPPWKVQARLMERCVRGGACVGYVMDGETVVTSGLN